jgi:hypothetical protein
MKDTAPVIMLPDSFAELHVARTGSHQSSHPAHSAPATLVEAAVTRNNHVLVVAQDSTISASELHINAATSAEPRQAPAPFDLPDPFADFKRPASDSMPPAVPLQAPLANRDEQTVPPSQKDFSVVYTSQPRDQRDVVVQQSPVPRHEASSSVVAANKDVVHAQPALRAMERGTIAETSFSNHPIKSHEHADHGHSTSTHDQDEHAAVLEMTSISADMISLGEGSEGGDVHDEVTVNAASYSEFDEMRTAYEQKIDALQCQLEELTLEKIDTQHRLASMQPQPPSPAANIAAYISSRDEAMPVR